MVGKSKTGLRDGSAKRQRLVWSTEDAAVLCLPSTATPSAPPPRLQGKETTERETWKQNGLLIPTGLHQPSLVGRPAQPLPRVTESEQCM